VSISGFACVESSPTVTSRVPDANAFKEAVAMKTQVSMKGCEAGAAVDGYLEKLLSRVKEVLPGARLSKLALEVTPAAHAVGLIVSLADGDVIVRHGNGSDWERAFMELDRRLDRLSESD
jgi:hypothetical protein